MLDDALRLENFTVLREGFSLFQPLSLELKHGEAVEILGPNGIGKTSFLEALSGLHKEFSGSIICSSSFFYLSSKAPFDPQETVEENLFFWREFWSVGTQEFSNSLMDWKLDHLRKITYECLSQGQKQRVNLARLSLTKANLWLLDEPTANLDLENTVLFKSILKVHLDKGGMALIATHDSLGLFKKIDLKKSFEFQEGMAA